MVRSVSSRPSLRSKDDYERYLSIRFKAYDPSSEREDPIESSRRAEKDAKHRTRGVVDDIPNLEVVDQRIDDARSNIDSASTQDDSTDDIVKTNE